MLALRDNCFHETEIRLFVLHMKNLYILSSNSTKISPWKLQGENIGILLLLGQFTFSINFSRHMFC
jgi:hypothetical protein